jgi:hypothetical protein
MPDSLTITDPGNYRLVGTAELVEGFLHMVDVSDDYSNGWVNGLSGAAWSAKALPLSTSWRCLSRVKVTVTDPGHCGAGACLVMQAAGASAIGASGAGLGVLDVPDSVAVKLDYSNAAGNPSQSCTGISFGGASPSGGIDMTGVGVSLVAGNVLQVEAIYYAPLLTLTVTITDTVTAATSVQTYTGVDIPARLGGALYGYVGWTAATGTFGSDFDLLYCHWGIIDETHIYSSGTLYAGDVALALLQNVTVSTKVGAVALLHGPAWICAFPVDVGFAESSMALQAETASISPQALVTLMGGTLDSGSMPNLLTLAKTLRKMPFTLVLTTQDTDGRQQVWTAGNVFCPNLHLPSKASDFTRPQFDMVALPDGNGVVATVGMGW